MRIMGWNYFGFKCQRLGMIIEIIDQEAINTEGMTLEYHHFVFFIPLYAIYYNQSNLSGFDIVNS